MTTDKLYQRTDYYCMLIYIQTLIWPATRPHCLLNFVSEKIGRHTIKLVFIEHILRIHNKRRKGSIVCFTKLK